MLLAALLLAYWSHSLAAWSLMIAALAWDLLFTRKHCWAPARPVLCLLCALLILGTPGFFSHPFYDATKDLWYFTKPVVELAFGCIAARRLGLRLTLWCFLVAATVVSADYVIRVLLDLSSYVSKDTYVARTVFGGGSFLSVIAIAFVLDPTVRRLLHGGAPLVRWCLPLIGALSAASVVLSQSRTLLVAVALFGVFEVASNFSRIKAFVLSGALALAVVASIAVATDPSRLAKILDPARIVTNLDELTVGDYSSQQEINSHWRGFESFLALRTFRSFDTLRTVIGGGFGQLVELDRIRSLQGVEFDAIPVLHNGFLYVLVKTGFLGLAIFGVALARLWRILKPQNVLAVPGAKTVGGWLAWVVPLSTAVISGPFNKTEFVPVIVLCGVLAMVASHGWEFRRAGQGRRCS